MATRTMTNAELLGLPTTVDIVTAGRALGLGRAGAYDLASRGEFPCRIVKVGRFIRVPRAELFRVLGVPETDAPSTPEAA